jgi:hypothetical protein
MIGTYPGHANKNRALERALAHQRRGIDHPLEAIPRRDIGRIFPGRKRVKVPNRCWKVGSQ